MEDETAVMGASGAGKCDCSVHRHVNPRSTSWSNGAGSAAAAVSFIACKVTSLDAPELLVVMTSAALRL
jgi:hypothetical protein